MKPLLLLHYSADCNTNDIWRAAIKRGWSTDRINEDKIENIIADRKYVRYYGNTLHAERIQNKLPFKFYPLNPSVLAETPLSKRNIKLMHLRDLKQPLEIKAFIKPVYQKYFPAKIYEIGEKIEAGSLPDDLIYIQEIVDIVNEVRCFCLNGKIHTASYYRISKDYNPSNLDDFRNDNLDEMVLELSKHYAPGIVLDFGFTSKGEWIFIEPNEPWASGLYDCNPEKCLDVIEASQY